MAIHQYLSIKYKMIQNLPSINTLDCCVILVFSIFYTMIAVIDAKTKHQDEYDILVITQVRGEAGG